MPIIARQSLMPVCGSYAYRLDHAISWPRRHRTCRIGTAYLMRFRMTEGYFYCNQPAPRRCALSRADVCTRSRCHGRSSDGGGGGGVCRRGAPLRPIAGWCAQAPYRAGLRNGPAKSDRIVRRSTRVELLTGLRIGGHLRCGSAKVCSRYEHRFDPAANGCCALKGFKRRRIALRTVSLGAPGAVKAR